MFHCTTLSLQKDTSIETHERRSSFDLADEIDEMASNVQSTSDAHSPTITLNSQHQQHPTEDEIGVTLDYQPSIPSTHDAESITGSTAEQDSTSTAHQSNDQHSCWKKFKLRSQKTFQQPCCTRHWIGHFISGIFTGMVFFAIGIVFVVYFHELPSYIGILFIMVGIPPCCMSINKWRSSRRDLQLRREAENRLTMVRRMRGDLRENAAYRNGELPYADLPPSYDNFAFQNYNEPTTPAVFNRGPTMPSTSSLSSSDDVPLPSYNDVLTQQKLGEHRRASAVSFDSDANVPKYEEIFGNENDNQEER